MTRGKNQNKIKKLSQNFCIFLSIKKSKSKAKKHYKTSTFSDFFENYDITNCISWTIMV